jgi:predicted RNA-binding protein with PIN domain
MAERFLIVDGHSIIFAWPELRSLHDQRTGTAREKLIRVLTEYQDFSGVHVVVVFDGKGATVSEVSEPGGIQIFYSDLSRTADDIVERLCATYAGRYSITVATSDLLEQQTAITFGAQCTGAEGLRSLVNAARDEFAQELKRRRKRL